MAFVAQDDGPEYWVLRDECLSFSCFSPGVYRKDGEPACHCRQTEPLHCCVVAAHHGCPLPGLREADKKTLAWRRRNGWKVTKSARLK